MQSKRLETVPPPYMVRTRRVADRYVHDLAGMLHSPGPMPQGFPSREARVLPIIPHGR